MLFIKAEVILSRDDTFAVSPIRKASQNVFRLKWVREFLQDGLCCVVEIMTKPRDAIESFIVLARVSFGWSQLKMVLPRME